MPKKMNATDSRPPLNVHLPSNPRGVLTDLDVLRVLAGVDRGPVFAAELGQALGLDEGRVAVRLCSLVSLGYAEQLMSGKDGGYTITARGRAAIARPSVPSDDAEDELSPVDHAMPYAV